MYAVGRAKDGAASERGAVMVMVAIWLPLLALFVSFAIDVAHFFDYSRNLQNRADAAALAAGDAYGNTCFSGSSPGQLNTIGQTAQQYAGPPGAPSSAANLPYSYASVTTNLGPYQNPPNLRAGTADNFFMILNGATSADKGGQNFSDGNFCSTDYTNPSGPAVDVWLTQEHLPLFLPLLGLQPNISAHARVSLQGEASSPFLRPIAVSDPGAFGCATVRFYKSTDNGTPPTPIATANLTETDPANFKFDNAANPVSVTIPNDDNGSGAKAYLYMQVFLSSPDDAGNCPGSNGEAFDDSTNSGIEVINSYGTGAPASNQAPNITAGGVTLCQAGQGNQLCAATPACDPYFSTAGCSVNLTANVTFAPDVSKPAVTATDTSTNVTRTLNNSGTVWTPNQPFNIGASTGQHLFRIDWSQKDGRVGGVTCTNQNPCSGTFGIQQQSFGACNGCDQPDDSGPIVSAQICNSVTGACDTNAYQQTSVANPAPSLVVKLQLAGIRAQSGAAAPNTILRFSGSTNHQTGLIDCGQGNGPGGTASPADAYTIYGGCGPSNPFEPPNCTNLNLPCNVPQQQPGFLNPLYVYGRGNPVDCSPMLDQDYTDWPSGNHQDCVQTTPGGRRNIIVCALIQRVAGVTPANFAANSNNCNGGTCPANNWPTPAAGDPREIDVVLTAPIDLAAAAGSPQAWVPIRSIAKFYVTGWDPSVGPNCNGVNDPFPGPPGGKQSQNGAIWGHWMSDTENGVGNGNPCNTTSIEPVNCVPVLTR